MHNENDVYMPIFWSLLKHIQDFASIGQTSLKVKSSKHVDNVHTFYSFGGGLKSLYEIYRLIFQVILSFQMKLFGTTMLTKLWSNCIR